MENSQFIRCHALRIQVNLSHTLTNRDVDLDWAFLRIPELGHLETREVVHFPLICTGSRFHGRPPWIQITAIQLRIIVHSNSSPKLVR